MRRQMVTLVVVATVSGYQVLDRVVVLARPSQEMINLQGPDKFIAAIKAPTILKRSEAVAKVRREDFSSASEEVGPQRLLFRCDPCPLSNVTGPVELDERA